MAPAKTPAPTYNPVVSLSKACTNIPSTLGDKPDAFLRQLAIDVHQGMVFGSWMFPNADVAHEMMASVFMALLFRDSPQGTFQIYEYRGNAATKQVKGYPVFSSHYCLTRYDVERLNKMLHKLAAGSGQVLESEIADPPPAPLRTWDRFKGWLKTKVQV